MRTLERSGIQQAQVLLASLGNAGAHPAGDGLGLDPADAGKLGGAAKRLDDAGGLGLCGMDSGPHTDPIIGISQRTATGIRNRPISGQIGDPQSAKPTLPGMNTGTFQGRLALAMDGQPRGGKSALAKACGISPTSVFDWLSGKTKMPTADLIFPAARFLNVSAEWLATGKGDMRPSVSAGGGAAEGSQPERLDAFTLGRAMRFARLWLTIRGDGQPLEKHPDLVLAAAHVIETLEANIDSDEELTQVMAKLATMGGADGIRRETAGGAGAGAGGGAG